MTVSASRLVLSSAVNVSDFESSLTMKCAADGSSVKSPVAGAVVTGIATSRSGDGLSSTATVTVAPRSTAYSADANDADSCLRVFAVAGRDHLPGPDEFCARTCSL